MADIALDVEFDALVVQQIFKGIFVRHLNYLAQSGLFVEQFPDRAKVYASTVTNWYVACFGNHLLMSGDLLSSGLSLFMRTVVFLSLLVYSMD